MTTASQKETVEEPQEPNDSKGPLSKIGDVVEHIIEDILDKKKPEPKPVDDPKPDPCCGPPNIG